jgi:protein gp37
LISWCRHTFNLWIGCWKIDPECANCYAAARDHRFGGDHWGRKNPRQWTNDTYWKQLARWDRAAREAGERRRVFVGSLMDWAETHPVAEIQGEMNRRRSRFFDIARGCSNLDFLMLTKRIEDARKYLPWYALGNLRDNPWSNIWIGTTAGTVPTLREHAAELRRLWAAKRFISCEPMLEDIPRKEWDRALGPEREPTDGGYPIDLLIVGAESGPGRRPMQLDWVRTAREAALAHGVVFHFKQSIVDGKVVHLPMLDGRKHDQMPS